MVEIDNRTAYYESRFLELRERLIRILGTSTVNRLIDRAVVEIGRAHPALTVLRADDGDEAMFVNVRELLADKNDDQVRDTFSALNGVILLLVARLLGREIALRLTEGVTVAELLESRSIGSE